MESMGSEQASGAGDVRLTPPLALVLSVTYMAAADGILQDEEGMTLAAFFRNFKNKGFDLMGTSALAERGGSVLTLLQRLQPGVADEDLMEQSARYYQETELDAFLDEAEPILSTEQKLCIMANVADIAFADGVVAVEEHEAFQAFISAFKLPWEEVLPYIKAIRVKNNLAVFAK